MWLPGGVLPRKMEDHLKLTDNEVLTGIREHGSDSGKPAHTQAQRILGRKHYRLARQFTTDELAKNPRLPEQIANDLRKAFPDAILLHIDTPEGKPHKFTVRMRDGSNVSSLALSQLWIPPLVLGYLLVDPDILEEVKDWLNKNKVSQA